MKIVVKNACAQFSRQARNACASSHFELVEKARLISVIYFCTLYFLFFTNISFAQEKTSAEIHKTKSSVTIGDVKYYLHTVEKGQTLFAIAKFYGRDVNDVVLDNPEAIDGIHAGQILKISVEKKKPATFTAADSSNYILHKVEQGQTLYSLTKQYGVSIEKLRALNPELKDGLKLGQTLKIPSNKPKKELPTTVKVTTETTQKVVAVPNEDLSKVEAADRVKPTLTDYVSELKDEYNVAFFLPFHADEANSIELENIFKGDAQLPNKTNVALNFYEGALLAIDSLKKQNLKLKLFVYDIDDKDSMNIVNTLKKPELASMDLMVGPLYGSGFMPFAKFAKEQNIPIVSPFTQVNKILFSNPYVCKVSPSGTLQVEQMAHFVVDTFHTQNIILVNNANTKEISFFNAFKSTANHALLSAGHAATDTVKEAKGLTAMQSMLHPSKINVVVLPSNNQSYVTEFISSLNGLHSKYKIVLVGMQNWINYDNLDFEYLNNLSLHIPSNSFVDFQNPGTKSFVENYREKYKTEPDLFAYQGFDISYYFISSLKKYGSGFLKNLSENKYQGIETNYNFSQFPSDSGFENKFVFILKYQDYKLMKAN